MADRKPEAVSSVHEDCGARVAGFGGDSSVPQGVLRARRYRWRPVRWVWLSPPTRHNVKATVSLIAMCLNLPTKELDA